MKVIKEFNAVNTKDEVVTCIQYEDGTIKKCYEFRRIGNNKIEYIQHRNRDKNGNYYTTKKIVPDAHPDEWLGKKPIAIEEEAESERKHIKDLIKTVYETINTGRGNFYNFEKTVANWCNNHKETRCTEEYTELLKAYEEVKKKATAN